MGVIGFRDCWKKKCCLCFTIWELEASRYDENDVRGCANFSTIGTLVLRTSFCLVVFIPPSGTGPVHSILLFDVATR